MRQVQFDLDGNQTLVRTTTGDWQVTYNGENRPISWSCGTTNITMKFDRMGGPVPEEELIRRVGILKGTDAAQDLQEHWANSRCRAAVFGGVLSTEGHIYDGLFGREQ